MRVRAIAGRQFPSLGLPGSDRIGYAVVVGELDRRARLGGWQLLKEQTLVLAL